MDLNSNVVVLGIGGRGVKLRPFFKRIEDFLSKDKAIKRKDLYVHMGFPNNVKDITRYRKLK